MCKNGGTCFNRNDINLSNLRIACVCKQGYSGTFCEKGFKIKIFYSYLKKLPLFLVNPCFVNGGPCMNNGTCQRLGSNGYTCLCNTNYFGYNCSQTITKCPPGWTSFNNNCFNVYKIALSFDSSIFYCASQSLNSYLADINSPKEFDFIKNNISSQAPNTSFWVF